MTDQIGERVSVNTSASGDTLLLAAEVGTVWEVTRVSLISDLANTIKVNDGVVNILGPYQATARFALALDGRWTSGGANRALNLNLVVAALVTGEVWVRKRRI